MDFSKLVTYVKEGDDKGVNQMLSRISPVLQRYLESRFNARPQDAKDSVQDTLITSMELIEKDQIRKPEKLHSFMFTTCRNNYLNAQDKGHHHNYEQLPQSASDKPRQLDNLYSDERKKLLEYCLERLSDTYKKFMEFWFQYPNYDASVVADEFDISVNTAWTRKHRAIKKLNYCIQKKMDS